MMYFRKRKKNWECLKSYKVMLKLILIFRSVLWLQAFLEHRTHFLSVETTVYLFLSIIQWKTGWNKDIFLKKVMYELRGLFIWMWSNGKPTDARLIMQRSLIAKKVRHWKWRPSMMILELYTFVVSCFVIKVISKNMALF